MTVRPMNGRFAATRALAQQRAEGNHRHTIGSGIALPFVEMQQRSRDRSYPCDPAFAGVARGAHSGLLLRGWRHGLVVRGASYRVLYGRRRS